MKRERVTFNSAGYELVGIKEIPDKTPAPGVILFHGLTNSKEDCPLINETATMLVGEGIACFRFDFFGSGESPGLMQDKTFSLMAQNAKDALDFFAADERISVMGLWGRSTGGTMVVLSGSDPRVRASVMASPSILVKEGFGVGFERIKRTEFLLEAKGQRMSGTGNYKGPFDLSSQFFEELDEIQAQILGALPKLGHVLVLATTPDQKVPLKNATMVINLVQVPKQIHIFENVDHGYEGVEAEAVELERVWFRRFLLGASV